MRAEIDRDLTAFDTETPHRIQPVFGLAAGDVSGFDEDVAVTITPRIQIDAVYGALTTDVVTLTSGTASAATASGGLFVCTSGTDSGGYGVVRSRRIARYRAGQGTRIVGTALFDSPVADSLQLFGGFNATSGVFFGYRGTAFGILRRVSGSLKIVRLTVTAAATGAETLTVTLNGVAFEVTTGGALSESGVASRIVSEGAFTGWTVSGVSPTANGATVTFIQQTPAVADGTYSLASTGAAAGTFAEIHAGAANDDEAGFVAQTDWNIDRLDGSGGALNPSGMTLDPTKLNVYRIIYPYLGAGAIQFAVMTGAGRFVTVHRIAYPNSGTAPSSRVPSFRVGWIAASLGATDSLTVKGASGMIAIEGGIDESARQPYSAQATFTASTTEYVALAVRSRGEFASIQNVREIIPVSVVVGTETNSRVVRGRVVLNPTFSADPVWSYVGQTTSVVEYTAAPTTTTISGGTTIATVIAASGSAASIDLRRLGVRIEPGDVIALALESASATALCFVATNWLEV